LNASPTNRLLELNAKWMAATSGLANAGCHATDCGHRIEMQGNLAEEKPLTFELILAP